MERHYSSVITPHIFFPFSANFVTALCLIFNLIQERGWNSTKIEQMSLEN